MHVYKLLEALKPSQYRNLVKGWDKNKFAKEFQNQPYKKDKNAYRIFIPVPSSDNTIVEPNPQVKQFLDQQGFEIIDYTKGQVKKKSDGRIFRLGRVLPDNLKQTFANDPSRQATKKETIAVISRHPYDIAGMSTDRGWTSCQNLADGSECWYVPEDIKHGTMIAYEVSKNDLNINKPLGRILIKPYINSKKETAFGIAQEPYGSISHNFMNVVKQWIDNFNDSRNVKGLFVLHGKVYPEADPYKIHGSSRITDSIERITNRRSPTEEIISVLKTLVTEKNIYDEYGEEMKELLKIGDGEYETLFNFDEDNMEKVSPRDTLMPIMVEKVLKIIQKHPKIDEIYSAIFRDRDINILLFDLILNSSIDFGEKLDVLIQKNIKNFIKNAVIKRDPKLMTTLLHSLYTYKLELYAENKEQPFIESMKQSVGFILKGTRNYNTEQRFLVMHILKDILPTSEVKSEYEKVKEEFKQKNPSRYRHLTSWYA